MRVRVSSLSPLALALALAACASESGLALPNSSGKGDSATVRLKLTDDSPVINLSVGCDQPAGCAGFVEVRVLSPEPCAFFADEPRCGIGKTAPMEVEVASVTVTSQTEGERALPLRIETGDGDFFNTSIAAGFSALGDEDVDVLLEKAPGAPDLRIEVRAEWAPTTAPGVDVAELEAFLATVPGLTFFEISTSYPGYRAYQLNYEQPLDHGTPSAGSFTQRIVLHHRDRVAPMVLYTSGYELFTTDFLSELGESLPANQLSTEQRFFGASVPFDLTPESWRKVTIAQAAADHHRIVEALRPFYAGAWLSTGHSKGGMTSIFHRRFFPDDLDATVAYVAPISFADPDPRYVPFLDSIGEDACREAIRAVQHTALARIDELLPLAEADAASFGATFVRSGGQAVAYEKAIEEIEWGFWQTMGAGDCGPFLAPPSDATALYDLLRSWAGYGWDDAAYETSFQTYYYQAATELGLPDGATAHLDDVRRFAASRIDIAPAGTDAIHDPAAMLDVQAWVKTEGSRILFLYGEYDPWTGGAYEIGPQDDVLRVTAPEANHGGALIRSLTDDDREAALAAIEDWIGTRPGLTAPTGAPRPPMPRGLP